MIRFWCFILQTSLLKTIIWISEFTSFIHYRWVLQETLVACCRESQLSSPGSLEWPSFRERIWQIVAWHYPWLQAFVSSENSWKYYFQFPIFLIFDDKHLRSEIFYELRFSLPIRFQNTISIKDMPIYTDSQNCLWVSLNPLLIIALSRPWLWHSSRNCLTCECTSTFAFKFNNWRGNWMTRIG